MIAYVFIKIPVTAIVISFIFIIGGILAVINLPIDQYPNIIPPTVMVIRSIYGS